MNSEERIARARLGQAAARTKLDAWRQQLADEGYARWVEADKHCPWCGKRIPHEKRYQTFCNRSCAQRFARARQKERGIVTGGHGLSPHNKQCERACAFCGTAIVRPVTEGRVYCNRVCQGEYYHRAYIARWQAGEETGARKGGMLSSHVRRYLLEKYEGRCARCGWCEVHPTTGKVPLEAHHIDGDSGNNVEGNLILLCPNCHSLTPTFRGLNRGNGRTNR